jgi:hypothetical protein
VRGSLLQECGEISEVGLRVRLSQFELREIQGTLSKLRVRRHRIKSSRGNAEEEKKGERGCECRMDDDRLSDVVDSTISC